MGLTFVPSARGEWFLRILRGLAELAQIHVTGEAEQPGGQALRAGLCGQSLVLLGDGDAETGHGGGDLAGQVGLRDGLVAGRISAVRRQTLSRGASRNLNNIGRLHDIVSTL